MRKHEWKRWAVAILSGSMLLQTPGCVEVATVVTGIATTLSAAGVLFIVNRIIST